MSMGGSSVLNIWIDLMVSVGVVKVEDLGPCFLGHFDCAGNSQAFVAFGAAKDPVEVCVRFDILAGVDSPGFFSAVGAFHAASSSG